ncbi:efflux RND transporter periplasmic adaptor subunit [Aliifodinibius salicampi]|uniref:Efflux RND transporter periplasmic adaptor subunit n=1 Tax=Fodinibius salicampi TaxID=1920655 RepID=A0ABT3Q1A5_9BACT|nr:efflux RND transporter periplasmic adaptor subunit [Fodinibius salicampi]MCW9713823.1 efflux RND transporter periplasmic adaptor subunit [Fodinibius salicampi]
MKKLLINFFKPITILFAVTLLVTGCSGENTESSGGDAGETASVTPAVEAVKARYGSLPLSERLSGTVVADNQVVLYPEISGRITQVHVRTGDNVQKGDPLVSLEDKQYQEQVEQARANLKINQAQLKQAQAQYRELESEYRRTRQLSEKELSSDLEMERMEAQMESAEADVELAEAQVEQAQSTLEERQEMLSQTVVRAPITGTVGQRNAEMGMQVGSNTQLFTIGDLDNLRVEVVLTDNMLNDISVGQTANIHVGDQVIEAGLSRISPFLNNVTRSTEGEIDVENENNILRPGMFVPVDILYGESQQATLIPTSGLYSDPNTGNAGVYVATSLGSEIQPAEQVNADNPPPLTEATEVQFREVDVIAEGRMEVAVDGVEPGDWVVIVGQDLLSEGRNQARVRTSSWERILAMQGMQRQDLLQRVLDSIQTANE